MATLQKQLDLAKKATPNDLKNELFQFIKSIEKELIAKNQEQLREDSSDIFGSAIGFYSAATEAITKGAKKQGEPFDAYDTGDLFKGMYMQEVSGVVRILSRSPHFAEIQKSESWLSTEIFGLTDDNLREVIANKLLPFFIENSRKKLNL